MIWGQACDCLNFFISFCGMYSSEKEQHSWEWISYNGWNILLDCLRCSSAEEMTWCALSMRSIILTAYCHLCGKTILEITDRPPTRRWVWKRVIPTPCVRCRFQTRIFLSNIRLQYATRCLEVFIKLYLNKCNRTADSPFILNRNSTARASFGGLSRSALGV